MKDFNIKEDAKYKDKDKAFSSSKLNIVYECVYVDTKEDEERKEPNFLMKMKLYFIF